MSEAAAIYNLERVLETQLSKVGSDINGEILLKYNQARIAEGLSLARIIKCINTLRMISGILGKRFDNASKDDIVELVSKIERLHISEWTKHDYKAILKKFYQWLKNCEEEEYPIEVKWLKHIRKPQNKLTKRQLLTEDEVNRLFNAATNVRDKALILVLLESGRRIGEVLSLKIECVDFDDSGAKLFVDGKTGTDFSRIISSAPALAVWLDNHPLRDDPKAPMWVTFGSKIRHTQLSYAAARSILKDCVRRAGLNKRVYFHLFRHTRATQAATKLTQMQMCAMLGWTVGSRMPAVYVHLSGEDIDEAQSIMNGVTAAKEKELEFQPKKCVRCKEKNSPTSKFCYKCGAVLDIEEAVQIDDTRRKVDEFLNKLTEDPKKLEKLLALIDG